MKSKKGEMALQYLDLGWSIIPITSKKTPYLKEWKPYQKRKPTKDEIEQWWTKWPNANLGVVTGSVSNLAILDADDDDDFNRFEAAVEELPQTITSHTPRGRHYFFTYPQGGLGNAAHINGYKIDVRGDGGYAIIPPSTIGRKKYKWNGINPVEDGIYDLLDMPARILAAVREGGRKAKKNIEGWQAELLLGVEKGGRNQAAAKLAGHYFRELPLDKEGNFLRLKDWNVRNKPPLSDDELRKVVNSIAEREGINTFGNLIGYTVTNFKRLIYPDGIVKYQLFLDNHANHMTLSSADFTNFNSFNQKFMDTIGRAIFTSPKKTDFLHQVDKLLQQAEIIEIDEEETLLGAIREIIKRRLDDNPENPTIDIDNRPIVYDGKITLKLTQLMHDLKMENETKKLTRKEVTVHLRQMGFSNNEGRAIRIGAYDKGGIVIKAWQIEKNKFTENRFL